MIPEKFSALVQAPQLCARVVAHDRDSYRIESEQLEMRAELAGRFRYENTDHLSYPAVGDYVTVSLTAGSAIIESVLPRNNIMSRRAVDGSYTRQAIAANIDTLFVVMAVNRDFNLRRLERYLVAGAAYEINCAVALSKIDLVEDPDSFVTATRYVAPDIPVLAISALSNAGLAGLAPFLGADKTIAFVGSSGVGKSTLVNFLLNCERLAVSEIRKSDDRGRHTTSRRCLIHLSDGTAVIDTPGMREFALADAEDGIDLAFSDLAEQAQNCRFRDCRHQSEPGCAVRDELSQARLESWRKLQREAAFEARKNDRLLASAEKQRWKSLHMQARQRRRF